MDKTKILEKVRKLLALGRDARGDANETAAALRQAQKLMSMHQLTETDVEQATLAHDQVKSRTSVSRPNPWEAALAAVVAKAFGCKLVLLTRKSNFKDPYARWQFVGLLHHVPIATWTFGTLMTRLIRARAKHIDRMKDLDPTMSRADIKACGDGFAIGWVHSVEKMLYAFALGDQLKNAIDLYVQKLHNSLGQTKEIANRLIDPHSLEAGRQAGEYERLHRPIHTPNTPQGRLS